MTTSTDEQLTGTLERLAARATTPTDGRVQVEQRLRVRRTRRRAVLGVAAAVGVVGLSAAAVNLGGADAGDTTVASTGEDAAAPSAEAQGTSIPRLSLSVPGLTLTRAEIFRTEFTAAQMATPLGYSYFQSFRAAADDWSTPGVFVYTTSAGAPFGIGEESPEDMTTIVDVNGHTGYLVVSGPERSLGWRLDDGTTAFVKAPELAPEEILAIGRSMTPRPDGRGWDVRALPDGLVPVLDEENGSWPHIDNHSLTFEGDGGKVELHSYTATRVDMEDRIADYVVGAQVRSTTVDGHPAVVARRPHDVRVLWYDDDDQVANYLIADGPIADDVERLVAGVTALSVEEWDDLLATADTASWSGHEPSD